MVGKVVSQSNCAELARITGAADNTTWAPVMDTISPSASTSSTVDVHDRLMQCYVDVATAVTFMVGLYQASRQRITLDLYAALTPNFVRYLVGTNRGLFCNGRMSLLLNWFNLPR